MENIKILVIDDSEFLLMAMKKFFDNYDFDVTTCNSGLEGIKYAARLNPDIIFVDLMMPNFNGIDVIKSIRVLDSCRHIPVVVLTAHKNSELFEQAKALGVKKILEKPLKRRDVFDVMDELLGGDQALSKEKLKRLFEKEVEKDVDDDDERSVELKSRLLKVFLKSADLRIRDIKSAINVKNQFMLKSVVHDLKPQGATIGYTRLTMLSEYLEKILAKKESEINWNEAEHFSGKIIDLIEVIKSENQEEL